MLGLDLVTRAKDSLYQICRGLKTVAMHTFREPITQVYPDKMPDTHIRGRLALTVNPETGEHLCISCRQCERVCPDKCIEITAHKSPETNKLELIDFKIDHGLCMFCGLCTEVCPTSCIINTNDFEMSEYSREALVYDIRKLTMSQEESGYYFDRKEIPLPKPKPAKAAPAAAGAAAAGAAKPAAAAAKPAEGAAAAKPAEAAAAAKPAEGAAAAKPAEAAAKPAEAKTEGEAKAADAKPAEAKEEKKADAPEKKTESSEAQKEPEKKDGEDKPKE
jgi:NADH-quinone oxidoreductase subunit I